MRAACTSAAASCRWDPPTVTAAEAGGGCQQQEQQPPQQQQQRQLGCRQQAEMEGGAVSSLGLGAAGNAGRAAVGSRQCCLLLCTWPAAAVVGCFIGADAMVASSSTLHSLEV
jgi:hypothetical protein